MADAGGSLSLFCSSAAVEMDLAMVVVTIVVMALAEITAVGSSSSYCSAVADVVANQNIL